MRLSIIALLLVALSACGSSGHVAGLGDTPVAVVDGRPLLTCGDDIRFPVSAMSHGAEDHVDRRGISEALAKSPFSKGDVAARVPALVAPTVQWKALVASPGHVVAAVGHWSARGPGQGAGTVDLARHGDHWEWESFGQCHPRPALGFGLEWLELSVPTDSLSPDSARLRVDLEEPGCTSGRDVSEHVRTPTVVETTRTITLYWTATSPPPGDYTCIGTIGAYDHRTLTLRRKLGHRTVLDGSHWPPKVLARP